MTNLDFQFTTDHGSQLGSTEPRIYVCTECLAIEVPPGQTMCRTCIEIAVNRIDTGNERWVYSIGLVVMLIAAIAIVVGLASDDLF